MKKSLIKLCSIAAIGLALTACNNDEANKKAMDADNSSIDQMVSDKVKTLDDSLTKVCDDQVTAAVTAKIDSMAKAGHKGAMAHAATHHHTPKPETKVDPKTPGTTKADKMGGNSGTGSDPKSKASKMGGSDNTPAPEKSKASKMGGNN